MMDSNLSCDFANFLNLDFEVALVDFHQMILKRLEYEL